MSLPKISVPNRNFQLGGKLAWLKSTHLCQLFGYGAIHGAKTAMKATRITHDNPMMDRGLVENLCQFFFKFSC